LNRIYLVVPSYVGATTPVAFLPFPLLSAHAVTLLPDRVTVVASAASSQSEHPGICVGVNAGVKARFICSQEVVGDASDVLIPHFHAR
jgi:hypothetical protein